MHIMFLGTSSMVPTKERNQSAVLISCVDESILVDCGEGTQRQLKSAGIKLTSINMILISHWHGDHVLGLPGLIQSMAASGYNRILEIYGPKGSRKRFEDMFKVFVFDRKIGLSINEVSQGIIFENKDYFIEAGLLEHGIETLGFSIQEKDRRKINMAKAKRLGLKEGPLIGKLQMGEEVKIGNKSVKADEVSTVAEGKKITIITDTVPCVGADKLAKNADLLVCEATYDSKLEEKSMEYNHTTAKQAAEMANRAGAKKLVLTHFSARYKDTKGLEEEAGTYFSNVQCAYDFMKVNV